MNLNNYLILPANRNVLAGRTVTSTAGTIDSDHHLSWLTDTRPAFPIRYPAGAWGVSVSVATKDIQLVVLANHSLDANVTVGGSVSGTISPPTPGEDDIMTNPFLLLDSPVVGATSLTLNGTNTADMVLGECLAGVPIELTPLKMSDFQDDPFDGATDALAGEFSNIPMYDQEREWRVASGSQIYTTDEVATILSWRKAQRGVRFPSVLIMDPTNPDDARVVLVGLPSVKSSDHKDLWEVRLAILEFPRYRWS